VPSEYDISQYGTYKFREDGDSGYRDHEDGTVSKGSVGTGTVVFFTVSMEKLCKVTMS
jgi:hypothetical protein